VVSGPSSSFWPSFLPCSNEGDAGIRSSIACFVTRVAVAGVSLLLLPLLACRRGDIEGADAVARRDRQERSKRGPEGAATPRRPCVFLSFWAPAWTPPRQPPRPPQDPSAAGSCSSSSSASRRPLGTAHLRATACDMTTRASLAEGPKDTRVTKKGGRGARDKTEKKPSRRRQRGSAL
jgi:hypothetical protein